MKYKLLILTILLTILTDYCFPQEWTVSDEDNAKVAPFRFTDSSRTAGEKVFLQNCTSCHGNPGKNNFTPLVPPPGDPATDKFQKQVDGALYYKITTGRGAMPSFKDVLTETERWLVISYFRSFNKGYVQPEPLIMPAGQYAGMDIRVNIEYDSVRTLFNTTITGVSKNDSAAIKGLEVSLYAKRYFGKLLIDGPKITNDSGNVVFNYGKILPGDTAGNIVVFVQINAEGLTDYKKEVTLHAGSVLKAGSLIDTRAMWTIARDAPVWLILSYSIVVIGIWSFLIYIILQIVKIRKLGKQP
jgi:hypothetical protein